MREVELHVPTEAVQAMGFDVPPANRQGEGVRDVTVMSWGDRETLVTLTFSGPVDDALTDSDTVAWWERLDDRGPDPTYLCRTVVPDLREGTGSGDRPLAVQGVSAVDDGWSVTVVGSEEALQCDGGFDERVDGRVSLRRLTEYRGPGDHLESLTRRQREVLEAAHELGYYEVPRTTTADDIASELGLDRSTVTEHLQRAERNLLSSVLPD